MASCHGTRIRDKRTPLVIGIVLIGRGEAETRIFSAINSRRLAEGKKRLQIIPRLPPWIFAFSFGANRDFLVFLSLSFFPVRKRRNKDHWITRFPRNGNRNAERNRTLRYISSPRFNGASIKRPREFEARAARPLFYEHVDSCLYRISDSYRGGVRACPKKECLKTRRGKCILLSLVLNRSRSFREI